MLQKETIFKILKKAAVIDEHLELFGSSTHGYKLNPVISGEFIRTIESEYSFTLPEDYFRFITEIGDGGGLCRSWSNPFLRIYAKGKQSRCRAFS